MRTEPQKLRLGGLHSVQVLFGLHMMNASQSLSYIVTGGAGFIGSNFVELLVKRGHHAIVLDALTYAGSMSNLENIQGPGRFTMIQGNICDGRLVSDLFAKNKPTGILNFAAESHVDRSIASPVNFIKTNVEGTFTLLEAALTYYRKLSPFLQKDFRFVQVSTDEVYGTLGDTGQFTETTPYSPNSPYSASKAAADHLVRAWHHTYGLPTITTHCSNNYGPKQFPEKLIPHMIHCALTSNPLPVYGTGKNVRDWIHVQDHCEGVFLAFQKGSVGQTYCFGGNSERSNIDVVKSICAILDELKPRADQKPHSVAIQFVEDRLGHDWRYSINDSLARKELGFQTHFHFEQGLRETVKWYLSVYERAFVTSNMNTEAPIYQPKEIEPYLSQFD